jgi:hypothetical protein
MNSITGNIDFHVSETSESFTVYEPEPSVCCILLFFM